MVERKTSMAFSTDYYWYVRNDILHSALYAKGSTTPRTHKYLLPYEASKVFAPQELIYGFEWQCRSKDDSWQGVEMTPIEDTQDTNAD